MSVSKIGNAAPSCELAVLPPAEAIDAQYGLEPVVPDKMPNEISYREFSESFGIDPDNVLPPGELDFGYDEQIEYLKVTATEYPEGVEHTAFNGMQSIEHFDPTKRHGSYGGALRDVVHNMLAGDALYSSVAYRERRVLELSHGIGGETLSRIEIGKRFNIGPAQVGNIYRRGLGRLKEKYPHIKDFKVEEPINRGLANPSHAVEQKVAADRGFYDDIAKEPVSIPVTQERVHPSAGVGDNHGSSQHEAPEETQAGPEDRQRQVDEVRKRIHLHGSELFKAEAELRQLLLDETQPAE